MPTIILRQAQDEESHLQLLTLILSLSKGEGGHRRLSRGPLELDPGPRPPGRLRRGVNDPHGLHAGPGEGQADEPGAGLAPARRPWLAGLPLAEAGVETVRVVHAAAESARNSGRWVSL